MYNFINNIIEESKYCSAVIKKHFNKELVTNKEDNEDFKNSAKCWKNYDSYLMQELGRINLKISVIPSGLEKYMSFTINKKLSFIDSVHVLH